jgi:hypothetical protein
VGTLRREYSARDKESNYLRAWEAPAMSISGHRSEAVYRRYAITTTEDIARAFDQTQAFVRGRAKRDKSRDNSRSRGNVG